MPARTLIIEDNPANLDLMTYLLSAFGHTPLGARDGEEGLAAAGREAPDLIVCDVQLPAMDGYEVARWLKTDPRLRTVPFVFITSTFLSAADQARGLSLGAAGFLLRPIDPQVLLAKIEAWLRAGKQR